MLGCLHAVTFEVGDFSATGDYGLFRQQLFCISSRQLKSRRVSRQQYITQIMKEWKTFSFAHKLARGAARGGLCFLMVRLFKHHAAAHTQSRVMATRFLSKMQMRAILNRERIFHFSCFNELTNRDPILMQWWNLTQQYKTALVQPSQQ